MFTDPADRVVRQAILTAGALRDQQSVPRMRQLLSQATDSERHSLITRILDRIGTG
jgi:hypothetical protein